MSLKKKLIISAAVISAAALTAVAAALTVLALSGSRAEIGKTEIQNFQTKNNNFKVAVISDTQLPPTEKALKEDDTFLRNFKNALNVIKNNNVDMILFAGDIGDLGTEFAFKTYTAAIDEVFGDDKPIIQSIMGNHDYWSQNMFTFRFHRDAYERVLGVSPWTHYVVNGYHFIGASPDHGNMTRGYDLTAEWLENELEKASADSDGKPIFVMTHNQPKNTSYGSEDWGDTTLGKVFSKYPNVINFSGHVHYSLLDERSVWQGDYTVMNTQSLSYTEMETDKENGTIPPNAEATPMGYIMDFTDDSITVHRINFADGVSGYEEKKDSLWSFALPYENDKKYSFENRREVNKAPAMAEKEGHITVKDGVASLSFAAGVDDDFVHSYKVVIDDKETRYFFSDFYNGIDKMNKTVVLETEAPKKEGEHNYKIFALDSWGEESREYTQING